jgi:quinolinate synthase
MLTEQLPRFPSLLISADSIQPQGAFAEAQAQYLEPDAHQVDALVKVLSEKRIGVVAHFYMDPQVQGVLTSAAARWPHIAISDSLVMADKAVRMVEQGCKAITVLGVDFMSENVRAILNEAGHTDVQVYRMDPSHIGCSLAEAAESPLYHQYLSEAAHAHAPALHVVYINTSLRTKAQAHAVVPTITCTSSNVVQTVLQGFAQVPDLTVWYGPDTYMGRNLAQLFTSLADQPDEEIQKLHKGHTQASIKALLPRLRYFEDGTCIVHHIFGGQVTELVQKGYNDALLTAHFEVPGEMFTLAMEAKKRGMGVVGSTQNILDFIAAKLQEALERPFPEKLQVVLGTESGMITSIVRKVQSMLHASGRADVQVEVVFPVSPEAITTKDQVTANGNGQAAMLPGGLSMIPGPASGEGCSTEGGCASCPYMKMNSLRALMSVCNKVNTPAATLLEPYKPMEYTESVNGRSMAEAGCEPILHMRAFQKTGRLPDALVSHIQQQAAA